MLRTVRELFLCELYTLTLKSGTVLRYTDGPQDLTVGGHTYLSTFGDTIPGFVRQSIEQAVGVKVETCQVDMIYNRNTLILGLTPGAFAAAGGFDDATISIDTLLTPSLNDVSRGSINAFSGIITDVEPDANRLTLTCSSGMLYLAGQFPRNYFLPSCEHALYDAGCTLNPATFTVTSVAVTSATAKQITAASLAQASGYFALGWITMRSGANNGLIRSVRGFASGVLDLLYPFPVAPAPGDLFDATPGCDKTETGANGCPKFSNLPHFRGFPFVPTPETIALGSNAGSPTDNGGAGAGFGNGGVARGVGGQPQNFKQQ